MFESLTAHQTFQGLPEHREPPNCFLLPLCYHSATSPGGSRSVTRPFILGSFVLGRCESLPRKGHQHGSCLALCDCRGVRKVRQNPDCSLASGVSREGIVAGICRAGTESYRSGCKGDWARRGAGDSCPALQDQSPTEWVPRYQGTFQACRPSP